MFIVQYPKREWTLQPIKVLYKVWNTVDARYVDGALTNSYASFPGLAPIDDHKMTF